MSRLQVAPPFSKVVVDYFGPIEFSYIRKRMKHYGCLFKCLVTRTVHLEVAFTLDTDSFIMCLRRFIARRGVPSVMCSDNGTIFSLSICTLPMFVYTPNSSGEK